MTNGVLRSDGANGTWVRAGERAAAKPQCWFRRGAALKSAVSALLVAAAVPVALAASESAGSGAKPRLTFGVISDIHFAKPGDENYFISALEYFRDNGADGVLCAGDLPPEAHVKFEVRPYECFGRGGNPIGSDGSFVTP